jgi:putative transposase
MLLTFKNKLNLSEGQLEIINGMSNDGRMLYNHFLGNLKNDYSSTGKFTSYYEQQKKLKDYTCTHLTFDAKKEILRSLHNNYSSFFNLIKKNKELNPKPPKFRGKDFFFTLSFTQDFIIKNNKLVISYQNRGKLEIQLEYTVPLNGLTCLRGKTAASDIKQLKIYKQNDSYFASITYEKQEEPQRPINAHKILSIDLGKKNLLAVYDVESNKGTVYSSENLTKNQKHLDLRCDELKSLRDTKKRGSRKYNQLNRKLISILSKKRTQTNLSLQKVAKDLSLSNKTIVIGELSNLKRNIVSPYKGLNRQMQNNWNLQTFTHLLEYKCALMGNQVVKVNEAWTSKTCCKCGEVNHGLSLIDRQYVCDCGNDINRDINGAINIYRHFMGDYNPPLDIDSTRVSERFDWCHINQMNRNHKFYI